jgi:hypothetical protein
MMKGAIRENSDRASAISNNICIPYKTKQKIRKILETENNYTQDDMIDLQQEYTLPEIKISKQ